MSRVPPVPSNRNTPPEKPTSSSPTNVRKVEKIEKVAETDPDQSRSRQKFRAMVDKPLPVPSEHPSPFEIYHPSQRSKVSASAQAPEMTSDPLQTSLNNAAVPGVAYSPAPMPMLTGTSPSEEPSFSSASLPRSPDVWSTLDEPPHPATQYSSFQEVSQSTTSKNKSDNDDNDDDNSSDEQTTNQWSPLDAPKKSLRSREAPPPTQPGMPKEMPGHKSIEPRQAKSDKLSSGKETDRGQLSPLPHPETTLSPQQQGRVEKEIPPEESFRFLEKAAPEGQIAPLPAGVPRSEIPKLEPASARHSKGKAEASSLSPLQLPAVDAKHSKKDKEKEKKKEDSQDSSPMTPPPPASLTPIALDAIPIAHAAAQAAEPYLGPEALAIYAHMVGSIVSMAKPSGDSRTEFLLNSPAFMDSKFYGSKIIIERFASAPYSVNIQLTGSERAVKEFQQNIPNLLAAFEKGKFAFGVNRLEAVYERPLFKRKEQARDKGSKKDSKEGQ